ncbi:hypothetical protein [Microbaculum marinisediminis]|uniref:Uncharacterized protein n=1 Tax=Microbaculum marinisediminis TaxID=2931392 RepID=A0AAW5R316_9HYPH|nr:hypothetical protein [Microbaculum sp. A6E488]MCT8974666.1 hypothetical protein [Microbaculum sp. A6E488]
MHERVRRTAVTFSRPFFVEGLDRQQSAGTYDVETIEAPLEGISFLAYRIESTSILLPVPRRGPNSFQLVSIAAAVVRAARLRTEKTERDNRTREV